MIQSYVLEMLYEGDVSPAFASVKTFAVPTYTTTISSGIVDGGIYRFRWYAINQFGNSAVSNELRVSATPVLSAPLTMTKNEDLSTHTSISLSWTAPTAGTSPGGDIIGYVLKVKECMSGEVWTAFDGVALSLPDQTTFSVNGFTPSHEYKVTVTAYTINGAGSTSSEFSFYSCIYPSGLAAPYRITSDRTQITIGWTPP